MPFKETETEREKEREGEREREREREREEGETERRGAREMAKHIHSPAHAGTVEVRETYTGQSKFKAKRQLTECITSSLSGPAKRTRQLPFD